MYRIFAFFGLLISAAPVFADVPSAISAFVQRAVPSGSIEYRGNVVAGDDFYYLFAIQQRRRRGIVVLRSVSGQSSTVVWADTSLDDPPSASVLPEEVATLARRLTDLPKVPDHGPSPQDINPLGYALNQKVEPITGFHFATNSTAGILRQLVRSDACPINLNSPYPGIMLVSPTCFQEGCCVQIGTVAILGHYGVVYEHDGGHPGNWVSCGPLREWLIQQAGTVQAFMLPVRKAEQR